MRAQVLAHGSRGLPRLSEIELLRGLVRQSLPVDKFPLELTEALYDAPGRCCSALTCVGVI